MQDEYRVLPHRDIALVSAPRSWPESYIYFHKPCGVTLREADVIEANWCPHCATIINQAARKRGQAAIAEG